MIITVTEVVLTQLLSYAIALMQLPNCSLVSKQKIKTRPQNTMAPSYHSKVISNQNKGV